MHSCVARLIFILATLSSALGISNPHRPSLLDVRSTLPTSTCIERFTSYYYASYNYVFFHDPTNSEYNYTIVTSHLQFYPATLTQWLEEKNFSVLNTSRATDDWLCGWHISRPVVVDGRRHGAMGWKRNPALLNTSTLHTPSPNTARQVVPGYTSIRPPYATIARVEAILRDNAPWADIYYFRSLMLGMSCGMLGGALVWYALLGLAAMRRQSKKLAKARNGDGIELDQIKVHDLSGAGMERMDADRDNGPEFGIEVVKPGPSTCGSVADPPPIYTLDGVGRAPVKARDIV